MSVTQSRAEDKGLMALPISLALILLLDTGMGSDKLLLMGICGGGAQAIRALPQYIFSSA